MIVGVNRMKKKQNKSLQKIISNLKNNHLESNQKIVRSMIENHDNVQTAQIVAADALDQDNVAKVIKIVKDEETVEIVVHVVETVNNVNTIVIVDNVNVKTNKKVIEIKTIKRNIKRTDQDQKKEKIVKFIEKLR